VAQFRILREVAVWENVKPDYVDKEGQGYVYLSEEEMKQRREQLRNRRD